MIDDRAARELGIFRKSHIPMGRPGCFEKIYTSQGDTGFKVWTNQVRESWRRRLLRTSGLRNPPTACASWAPISCSIRPASGPTAMIIGRSPCRDTQPPSDPAGCIDTGSDRESGEFGSTGFWNRSIIAGPTGQIGRQGGLGEGRGDHRRVRHRGNPRNQSQLGNLQGSPSRPLLAADDACRHDSAGGLARDSGSGLTSELVEGSR